MNKADLQGILELGDENQCAKYFQGLSEADRRAIAPSCIAWFKEIRSNDFIETEPGKFVGNPLMAAAATAVFATASLSELKKLGWQALPHGELLYAILLDRRPKWLGDWVASLLDEDRYWNHWLTVRRLIRDGLIQKPTHPNYYLGMISGLLGPGGLFQNEKSVERTLLEDTSLLKDEVWRLFELEGAGENSLANWDRFSRGEKWSDSLIALVRSGHLSRDQLLSCSLDALERDFNHYRAKWFATFHDALEPSVAEQQDFARRYLSLLGVSAPNIVSWAFKKVEVLNRNDVFDTGELIAGLYPVLESRQKGIVKNAIKLLSKAGKQSPGSARDVANAALIALAHEASDVQAMALDLIEGLAPTQDQGFAKKLADIAEIVAPSERERLVRWLAPIVDLPATLTVCAADDKPAFNREQLDGLDAKLLDLFGVGALVKNINRDCVEIQATKFDGTDIPRLDADEKILPIEDLDELIEVCSRVIEDDSLVDDVERVLDGVSRLCGPKPHDFEQRIGPLLKRATQGLKKNRAPFVGVSAGDDICGLVYAWCTGTVLEGQNEALGRHAATEYTIEGEVRRFFSENLRKAVGFLSRHVLTIARRVSIGEPAHLLSAPTHSGGWIDPLEFARRVNASDANSPDVMDVCLAMLRLAPDHRIRALSELKAPAAEWERAIHYALGGTSREVGETAELWIAAARCRSPWSDDASVMKAFPNLGPDAGQAASYQFEFQTSEQGHTDIRLASDPSPPKSNELNCVTVTFHSQRGAVTGLNFELGGAGGKTVGSVRWTATIWPQARESFFAAAVCDIVDNLDWWEARWQNKALLEPLLDPRTPLRQMGLLLLATGLAAKDPGEYGLATDIAIRAIEDGRLGSDNFGPMLSRLLPTQVVKPQRWQKRLAEVAAVSPLHALVVQQSLQHCFSTNADTLPRGFAGLLDLLKELSISLGQHVSNAACREALASITGSTKAAKTAKALLSLCEDESRRASNAIQLALDHRLKIIEQISGNNAAQTVNPTQEQ